MSTYQIKQVTEENWRAVSELTVHPRQVHFIETNIESLLEAAYDTKYNWTPYGLYLQETLIGFAMIGAYDAREKYIWLDRFMIDQKHQGQGHSKPLLNALKLFIKENWKTDIIILSVHPLNEKASKIYEQVGFHFNDRLESDEEERLMEYYY